MAQLLLPNPAFPTPHGVSENIPQGHTKVSQSLFPGELTLRWCPVIQRRNKRGIQVLCDARVRLRQGSATAAPPGGLGEMQTSAPTSDLRVESEPLAASPADACAR